MRGGIRGRIPLVRRTHILDDEMTPHSIDRGLAGSSKQRRRDDFDLKGRSREHLVGAGITVWYQEASARNSSVHELVTTRTQISLQCSFKHAWCVYSPPPPSLAPQTPAHPQLAQRGHLLTAPKKTRCTLIAAAHSSPPMLPPPAAIGQELLRSWLGDQIRAAPRLGGGHRALAGCDAP